MRTTKEVFEHHIHAVANANLAEISKDYADSSKLITDSRGVYSGKAAIMKFFEDLGPLLKAGKFTSKTQIVEGKAALFVWDFSSPSRSIENGVDSFFIEDGAIIYQTMKA